MNSGIARSIFYTHRASLSLLLAATMWGLLWIPLRYFSDNGVHGLWSSVIAYLVAVLPGVWLVRAHFRYFSKYASRLFFIALTSGWCNVAFIVAVAEHDAARMVLLFYLSPVWAIILGIIFLRERPTALSMLVALLALVGAVLMLYRPDQTLVWMPAIGHMTTTGDVTIGTLWPRDFYDWLAISSGLAFAITNLLIRGLENSPVVVKSFSSWIGVIIVALVWLQLSTPGAGEGADIANFPDIKPLVWVGLIALGLFGVTLMTLAVQYGVSHLPLYKSSIILVFEVVVTIVSSLLLSDEQLLHTAPYGAVLIIFAAILAGWTGDSSKQD